MSTTSAGAHDPQERPLVTYFWLQMGVALATLAFGLVIILGAIEYDVGWGERGPEPGYFPFWMGVLVALGSLGTLVQTFLQRSSLSGPALTRAQAARALQFLVPMTGFVLVASFLGLYVATIAYLFVVMVRQGGYRWPIAAAASIGTAVAFYLVFDKWLLVPLMKGPLEAWLGIY